MLPQHEIDEAQRTALELAEQPKSAEPVRRWVSLSGTCVYELRIDDNIYCLTHSDPTEATPSDMTRWVARGYFREIGPEVKTPGLRCVCQWCSADLPHSDRKGHRISHGQCNPACAQTPEEWRKVIEQI